MKPKGSTNVKINVACMTMIQSGIRVILSLSSYALSDNLNVKEGRRFNLQVDDSMNVARRVISKAAVLINGILRRHL